jgi:predicted dinucleotide-binding enzyme
VRIGIIGSGRIGGNAGRLFARAGHEVLFSFSRDAAKLDRLAEEAGPAARVGGPAEAVAFGDVVMLSVPWPTIDAALAAAGPLADKIVIDTTNQFGPDGVVPLPDGVSAAAFNARRMPGARPVKSFNTLTAGFQAEAAGRTGANRVALFYAGEDAAAKSVVAALIVDAGFAPVDVGGWDGVGIMEAPRRPGAVYGEEYRPDAARRIADALRRDPAEAARLAVELKEAG